MTRRLPLALLAALPSLAGCSPLVYALLAAERHHHGGTIQLGETVQGSTEGSDDDYQLTCATSRGSGDASYTFVAPETRDYVFNVSATYDSALGLFRDGTDTSAACNDDASDTRHSQIVARLQQGHSYLVVVDGYSGQEGHFTLAVTPAPEGTNPTFCDLPGGCPPATPNDVAAGGDTSEHAEPVGTLSVGESVSGSTAGGHDGYRVPCVTDGRDDDWVFVPPHDAHYRFHVDSQYDAALAVFVVGSPDALACNDDHVNTSQSEVELDLHGGQRYAVVVDGYNGATGSYTLRAEEVAPASTQDVAGNGSSATVAGGEATSAQGPTLASLCAQAPRLVPLRDTPSSFQPANAPVAGSATCGGSDATSAVPYRIDLGAPSTVTATVSGASVGQLAVSVWSSCDAPALACARVGTDSDRATLVAHLPAGSYVLLVAREGAVTAPLPFTLRYVAVPDVAPPRLPHRPPAQHRTGGAVQPF